MTRSGRPTMVDVARDAGVSLKTVSRVINEQPNVDAALVERVNSSIARLGFHRNALAASLRSGNRDTIGFLAADLSNTFYMTIAAAVSAVANARRMQVIMASSEEDAEAERALALDLCQRRVGGLILVPAGADQSYLVGEVAAGTPIVFLDRPGGGLDGHTVLIDNRGGAQEAVEELLRAGHRRIALLFDSPAIFTMAERKSGALAAFDAVGRMADPALVVEGLHTPAAARDALDRLLDSYDPPTAVFCANNRATIGALQAVLRRDMDIAVTGFDDFELAEVLPRRIRIVEYDTARLGTVAVERLLAAIDGDTLEPPSRFLLPTRLVDRGGSTH